MSWDTIRDQDGAVRLLRQAIATERVAPAYLFAGPASVGKALAARVFAQALNCEQSADDPCGACYACKTTTSGNFPDLIWASPEKRSRTISVDTARRATQTLGLAPHVGKRRVAVFDGAECMNAAAQNALLKTLEEPASRSLLILISSQPDALLPTVRSRCQTVRFRALETATVADILEGEGVAASVAGPAAAAAEGSVETARALADSDRISAIRSRIERALDGDSAGAAADHAAEFDAAEKALQKSETPPESETELLSKEQRKQLLEEYEARVQRAMAERVEADFRLVATFLRDGMAAQVTDDAASCVLGAPVDGLRDVPAHRLTTALHTIDQGLRYVRQYIRRDRVLCDLYGAIAETRAAA